MLEELEKKLEEQRIIRDIEVDKFNKVNKLISLEKRKIKLSKAVEPDLKIERKKNLILELGINSDVINEKIKGVNSVYPITLSDNEIADGLSGINISEIRSLAKKNTKVGWRVASAIREMCKIKKIKETLSHFEVVEAIGYASDKRKSYTLKSYYKDGTSGIDNIWYLVSSHLSYRCQKVSDIANDFKCEIINPYYITDIWFESKKDMDLQL